VDAARILLDRHPAPPASPQDPSPWVAQAGPSTARLLADTATGSTVAVAGLLGTAAQALRQPVRTARSIDRMSRSALVGLQQTPTSRLNVAVGPRRRFETFSVDLAQLRTLKRALGCSVNDLVLCIVAGGLHHYLTPRGRTAEAAPLRAIVPVSTRHPSQRFTLGNRVSALFVDIPVHLADPLERARAVNAEMGRLKQARHAECLSSVLSAAEYLPARLYAAAAAQFPPQKRSANLVITNVPGPGAPLYCMGAKLTDPYPYLGPVGHMALMVAVLRYNQRLYFGLAADPDTITDMAHVTDLMEKSANELLNHPIHPHRRETRKAGRYRGQ
jgi:diacylglycerol O-acyltransferase / wax synthase